MTIAIKQAKVLMVEGKDEENFFEAAFADHVGITDVQVLGIGGKTLLAQNLKTLTKDPAFSTLVCLAVVRDADLTAPGNPMPAAAQALAAVNGALASVHLPNPAQHGRFVAGPPRVGVFIMPNGVDDGMLETLCLTSVSGDAEYHCLTDYVACLQGAVTPFGRNKGKRGSLCDLAALGSF